MELKGMYLNRGIALMGLKQRNTTFETQVKSHLIQIIHLSKTLKNLMKLLMAVQLPSKLFLVLTNYLMREFRTWIFTRILMIMQMTLLKLIKMLYKHFTKPVYDTCNLMMFISLDFPPLIFHSATVNIQENI